MSIQFGLYNDIKQRYLRCWTVELIDSIITLQRLTTDINDTICSVNLNTCMYIMLEQTRLV